MSYAQAIDDLDIILTTGKVAQAIDDLDVSLTTSTGEEPQGINLTSPASGDTGVAVDTSFSWASQTAYGAYRILVDDDSQFSSPVDAYVTTESGSLSSDLASATEYSWKVQGGNIVDNPVLVPEDTGYVVDDSAEGDLKALQDIYAQTGGPEGWWVNDAGWSNISVSTMGDAYGVTVWESGENQGRVRSIRLDDNGLRNIEIDPQTGNPVVTNIAGDIIEVGADSETGGGTSKLAGLAINSSDRYKERYKLLLNKELKQTLGNLKKCETFSIVYNQLGGPLPDEAWTMTMCKNFAIGGYDLPASDGDPIWLDQPYNTKWNLWYNKFEGSIHTDIGTLMPSLEYLWASRNYFDNTEIPDSLWDLTGLKGMNVGHCGFTDLPSRTPAFSGTIEYLAIYGGTAHSNRNDEPTKDNANNIVFERALPEGLGNCSLLENFNKSYNNWTGAIPTSYQNLTNLRAVSFISDGYTGSFPTFFNKDNITNMYTIIIRSENFTPNEGLPSDYNVSGMSGSINFQDSPIGGVTPNGWRDAADPLNFDSKLQILQLANCGIGGPMMTDLSKFTNMKFCLNFGNNFTNEVFQDYPENFRLTQFNWAGSSMFGIMRRTIRNIKSENLWQVNFNGNEISGYETGAFGAIEFDSNDDYVSGLRGWNFSSRRFWIQMAENQLNTENLDNIILDLYANLLSREGTDYELTNEFKLELQDQKTGATPSNTAQINNAIAYMEQYGTVTI